MSGWVWVPLQALYVVHDRQIARQGGAPGVRDAGLLEMGCARPLNLALNAQANVFDLAAAYVYGIA